MTWLTLRLQRGELILLLAIAIGVFAAFVATYEVSREVADRSASVLDCPVGLAYAASGQYCPVGTGRLYPWVSEAVPLFPLLPLGVALLLVFPSMTELSGRTYRVVWAQSATRWRWARSRLAPMLLVGLVLTGAGIVLVRWWLTDDAGWYSVRGYDVIGIVNLGWLVFAVGLGLTLGTALRRPLIALALTSVAYILARLVFIANIRPGLIRPERMATMNPNDLGQDVWVVDSWYQRADGFRVPEQGIGDLCREQGRDQVTGWLEPCLQANGLTRVFDYQPESRYWPLQFVETGLLTVIGLVLIGWSVWYWLRRLE